MSDTLSTIGPDIKQTIESAKKFKCPITKHDGSDQKLWFPQVLLTQDDQKQYYIEKGIEKNNVKQKYDPLMEHYICYIFIIKLVIMKTIK